MAIRLSNLRLRLEEPEASLGSHAARALGIPDDAILHVRILRMSLDTRRFDALRRVYSLELKVEEENDLLERVQRAGRRDIKVEAYHETPFSLPFPGKEPLSDRPIIVGSGPAGLAAGYFLAVAGYAPIVLERGRKVRDRIRDVAAFDGGGPLDPESNYLFGEGGAGTFSDGKLTCRGSGEDVRRILELFAECKGKPSIVYEQRPHLGSNRLPAVVKALRQRIERNGGEVRFGCRLEDLDCSAGAMRGLTTSSGYLPAKVVVLATGHSARDVYGMLAERGVPMVQKAFQFGVRIEQPQETVNRVHYGARHLETVLGSADYSLIARGQHNLFTFCMCAGGYIIPSVSEPGCFCTNGMSLSRRDSPYANSGLMITIEPHDFGAEDVLAGVRLQEQYERRAFVLGRGGYACPIQRAEDFLASRKSTSLPDASYPRELISAQLEEVIPPFVAAALRDGLPIMNQRWHGAFLRDAALVGPEARGSAPVRIVRDDVSHDVPGFAGLYPAGEGAGYAGGIVSAAVDGLRIAKSIIAKYAPLRAHG
jgi:uncharacterized FAD-dependent dehydrogenase